MTRTFLILFIFLGFSCQAARLPRSAKTIKTEFIFENAPFKECHASTIAETSHGSLLAAWFGGTHENNKDVEIWISTNQNGRWSAPQSVANGIISDSERYACWNPVLFQTTEGTISLYYKVGLSPVKWWGMVIHSTDEGKTWSRPERLPDGILGPIKNKPIKLASGVILSPSSIETESREWHAHVERSTDNGKSWEKIDMDPQNPAKVIQPTLLTYPGGKIQALLRSNQNCIMESWSADEGKTWTPLTKLSLLNPNSGIDGVTLKSGIQALIYNPTISGKEWSNGRSKLNIAVSIDGNTWKDLLKLEDQATGEFSYPAIIQTSDGLVHIVYTYNRKTIKHVVLKF
jgi:alpha-L-fucosidase